MKEKEAREIYFGFYVLRGDASENRIKEVKNKGTPEEIQGKLQFG